MQARKTAIILSLGMLFDDVDVDTFVKKVVAKAKKKAGVPQALAASLEFNLGLVDAEAFKTKVFAALELKEDDYPEFWADWSEMIKIGDLAKQVAVLHSKAEQQGILFYLESDTNMRDLERIQTEATEQKIVVDLKGEPPTIADFPLYTTCQQHKPRAELVQDIVTKLQTKAFNKPDEIILILREPENELAQLKQQEVAKQAPIIEWCQVQGVVVHHRKKEKTLADTLTHILTPASVAPAATFVLS